MECSIEMDARRSQMKRLLQRVHEATSIVELDAAEQACADASPAAVECAGAVSQRRAELAVPLLLRAQRAESLAELDATREACAEAFVDCADVATLREARITDLLDDVRTAADLARLDAAADACGSDEEGAVDCAAEVSARRVQITQLRTSVAEAAHVADLDAAAQGCADALPAAVECDGMVAQRRGEIVNSLRQRARAAAGVEQLAAMQEECEDAFVNCTVELDARNTEITAALMRIRIAYDLEVLDWASNTSESDPVGMLAFPQEVSTRRVQFTQLRQSVSEATSIVGLTAAEQACDDAVQAVDVEECYGWVSQRRAEIQDPVRESAGTAASFAGLAVARAACAEASVACSVADVREAELSALETKTLRAQNTDQLEAAEDACVSHGRSGADCATAVHARDLQITELHTGIREAVTIAALDAAEQACADAVPEVDLTQCASLVAQRRLEIEASLLERVRVAASLSQMDVGAEDCEDAFVSCSTVADVRKVEVETVLADLRTVPNLYLLDAALATSAGMQMKRFSSCRSYER